MITELTREQRNKIKEYRDRYLQIGLSTDRIDKKQCIQDINDFYTQVLKYKKPRKVIICQSPYKLWHMLCFFKVKVAIILKIIENKKVDVRRIKEIVKSEIISEIGSEIGSEIISEIRSEIRSEIDSEIISEIISEIRSKIGSEIGPEIISEIRSEIRSEIISEIRSKIGSEIDSEIRSEIWSEIRSKIGSKIISEIDSEIWSEIDSEIGSEIISEIRSELGSEKNFNNFLVDFICPYLFGAYDVDYFAYCSYLNSVLGLNFRKLKQFKIYENTMNYGFIFPLKNVCFVSEKPIEINRVNRKLHADMKPALKYSDGFCLWRLNGIKVPKWLVMTKPEDLDVKKIMAIKNVEVRRVAVRKIGNTLLMEKLPHEILDKRVIYIHNETRRVFLEPRENRRKIEYFLIKADLGLPKKAKMLKMRNPSLKDVWHYEFVTPDCRTVEDAIKFRNGVEEIPLYLS